MPGQRVRRLVKNPMALSPREDVAVGDALPEVPEDLHHRRHAALGRRSETLRRDHYDAKYAIEHDRLPNAVMSARSPGLPVAAAVQLGGPDGWVLKAAQKNARMVDPGLTVTFFGTVTEKHEANGLGYVELEIGPAPVTTDVARSR